MFIRPRNPPRALICKMGGIPKKLQLPIKILLKNVIQKLFGYRKKLLLTNFHAISVHFTDYIK